MLQRLSDWWERMGPREKRLAWILLVSLGACVLIYVCFTINDGLRELEEKNAETRTVLRGLDDHRDDLMAEKSKAGEVVAMIGEEAPALATYLEKAGSDVGVQIRAQTDKPMVQKGKFHELAVQITLFDTSLQQLADFLKKVETTSPIVVTQRLYVKRNNVSKEKMDRVEITVATYERGRPKAGDKTGDKEGAKPDTKEGTKAADVAPAPAPVKPIEVAAPAPPVKAPDVPVPAAAKPGVVGGKTP